ncbi:uncharacterized protein LOC128355732 [Scomber scombrus]|uniref:Uncharacterized protein LOC128355732 n=1 Tax=Scomber scombrus TaxID=13677 RepID=A0AAV1PLH6_SCOSC|nr:uncharacterized protein LOC134003207 [Scomber scombrus]
MANRLLQLRVFVNERLTAAAEEIFGAVERTILEYRNDMYLSREDVKQSGLLMLAEGLNRQMEFSAVSQEVSVSEAEASTQPTHTADASPEPQEHWTSRDNDKLQELYEQSTQPISRRQTQTDTSREEELLPSTSTDWLKTEEEDDGYERSEAANFWQPLSSDSMDEHDTSDAEYTERGDSNSCLKTVKSKQKAKQRLLGTALGSQLSEQQPCLPQTPPFANMVMMQLQAKTATLPLLPALTPGKKRKRCQSCPKKKDTKTSTICLKCQKYICKAHCQTFTYCLTCI